MHSPRTVLRWSVRSLYVTTPGALLLFAAWALRWKWLIPYDRPQTVLMAYLLLLLACVTAVSVALLAGCHLAIHQAFRAGLDQGRELPPKEQPALRRRPRLRAVGPPNHAQADAK